MAPGGPARARLHEVLDLHRGGADQVRSPPLVGDLDDGPVVGRQLPVDLLLHGGIDPGHLGRR
jgi:hypothetical protein